MKTDTVQNKAAQTPRFVFFANREVRRVPLDWEHPRDSAGRHVPLENRRLRFTDEEIQQLLADGEIQSVAELERTYMPDFAAVPAERMCVCAYETTTEGTPISPVFPDTPSGRFGLVKYCSLKASLFADHRCSDFKVWSEILFGHDRALVDPVGGTVELLPERSGNQV
jgi:hypothetical protein